VKRRLPSGEPDATLVAIEDALGRDTLDESTRSLLELARDAVRVAREEADSARRRYHTLFDAVPDPVSILDNDGIVVDINKASMEAYGRPREDIVGQSIGVLNPELPRDHMAPVWDALNRGDTYVVEATNMRADGRRFPVEVHSAGFVHDAKPYIIAVARDLSGRRDAELRYRELMELIDTGILIRDAKGRIVHANAALMRLFDISPNESAAQALRASRWLVIDEHGRELSDAELPAARALRTGRVVSSTVLGFFQRQRRRLLWVSVTSVPQFETGSDRVQQVLTLYSDVTELKRDSALFDRAQALAHIGGWEWDAGRDRLYLTDEAQRILGRERAPETMDQLLAILRDDDRRRLRAVLDDANGGGQLDLELQGTRSDGHAFWVRMIGADHASETMRARVTGTLQDITERKQAEETLRVRARTDPLTSLLNRDAVLYELQTRLDDPTQSAVAVLYIDLDRFKIVNDVLGHAAGDRLLTSAAKRIQGAVGSEGLIARFGGDEFLVICHTGDDASRPQRLADAVIKAFGDSFRMDGEEFSVTASVGVAEGPGHGETAQALIQSADVAMYDSKRRGRNSWQPFTAELAAQQQNKLQLENQLRRAVENDEFRLVYQPQFDLASGRILATEALIRWRNSSLGEIRPDHFIGHAESTGDIVGIGGWVLREACRQMAAWRAEGVAIERVAVNVSYRQFIGEDLPTSVRAALAENGLPGSALELEFTERVLIEDVPDTHRVFAELRELGVTLTIDDFGEGYSALNYLRRLPIHGLKLSQLFVQGVPGNQSDVAVCNAVAGIAQSLGLMLVAEGVENDAQLQFLRRLGVTVGQGFLFAAGLEPEEIVRRYGRIAEFN